MSVKRAVGQHCIGQSTPTPHWCLCVYIYIVLMKVSFNCGFVQCRETNGLKFKNKNNKNTGNKTYTVFSPICYYWLIFGLLRISIGLSVFRFVANEYRQITIRSLLTFCNIQSGIR
jgi:hypothetical protein